MKDRETLLAELSIELFALAERRFEENNIIGYLEEIVFQSNEEALNEKENIDIEDLQAIESFRRRKCRRDPVTKQWVCSVG